MTLSTTWVVVIIVIAIAAIIGTITALKKNNKPFEFPEGYENPAPYSKDDEAEGADKKDQDKSSLI